MAKIADFMNTQQLGPIEQGLTNTDGVPVMATPAVAVPVTVKITAGIVAFTIPVGAYVAGRVVN
ncbi:MULTISPECIES: hypothetical protein [unclassified Streptomyces]|uniref:hypothetical protein n=1 Tax=unclassified Streptomyces TaxID=2593676 RepID=UPI000DAF1ED6|nr:MULTISPECIES: hypothetical protein [unclassified Streptomyces]PZT75938.1 hypothetical protein DNK56_21330 [Streptomyces sp. AC1-42W]PZT80111.1 hypothetical protein DNK55_11355 [Streptomyces sp. AC1-42T]